MHSLTVGPDLVTFEGDAVVIHARRAIPDWKVREFHHQPIFFRSRKYYLRHRSAAKKPFAVRYELVPWPADLHEESNASFTYDETLVAERDAGVRLDHRRTAAYYCLLPAYPLLGFCWSGFKERVLWPMGFLPDSITAASTFLTFGFALLDGIMFGYLGGGLIAQMGLPVPGTNLFDLLLLATLILDCAVRYGQLLDHEPVPDGFLEWLFRFGRNRRT